MTVANGRLEDDGYRKSSFSSSSSSCVYVKDVEGGRLVASNLRPDEGPIRFTAEEWSAFVAGVKDGQFD